MDSIEMGDENVYACLSCYNPFSLAGPNINKTFFGFQTVTCPHCNTPLKCPLTSGYRMAYWVLCVFFLVGLYLALGCLIALAIDRSIRRKFREAKKVMLQMRKYRKQVALSAGM